MKTVPAMKEQLWSVNFVLQALANFFLFFSYHIVYPTLPIYMVEQGMSIAAVGLVIGITTVFATLVRPFSGSVIDLLGRKSFAYIGLAFCLLSTALYGFASTLMFMLVLRAIHGIGWGIANTCYGTIVTDIVPASRRGEGLGYYGTSSNLSLALSPVIGIWVMGSYGLTAVFIVAVVFAIISVLLFSFVSVPPLTERPKTESKASFASGLFEKNALFPSLLILFITTCYGGMVTFMTLFGKEADLDGIAWFFPALAVSLLLCRPLSGKLYDRLGPEVILIPAPILGCTGLILLSYADSTLLLVFSACFFGVSFGSIQPALLAWTIQRVEAHKRGAANATFYTAFDTGVALGNLIIGFLAGVLGSYALTFRASSVLCLVFFVTYVLYLYRSRRHVSRSSRENAVN